MNPTEELIEAIEEKEYKHISVSTGEATPSGVIQVFDVKDVLSVHLPKIQEEFTPAQAKRIMKTKKGCSFSKIIDLVLKKFEWKFLNIQLARYF